MLLCQLITDGNELTFFPRLVPFIHLFSAISGAKLRSQRKYQSVPTKEMCSTPYYIEIGWIFSVKS